MLQNYSFTNKFGLVLVKYNLCRSIEYNRGNLSKLKDIKDVHQRKAICEWHGKKFRFTSAEG